MTDYDPHTEDTWRPTLLEVRPSRQALAGLLLSIAALLVSALALGLAIGNLDRPAPPTTHAAKALASTGAQVVEASHRGGPSVVMRKVRRCSRYVIDGKRTCRVVWVRKVRHRVTLEEFRTAIGYRA